MQLIVNNIDECKASPKKDHIFIPTKINKDLEEKDKVKFHCLYFQSLEKLDYARYDASGAIRYDFKAIFKDKITSIENLSLVDVDGRKLVIATPEDALNLVSIPEIESAIVEVALYLISSDSLTRDEVKNFESAISS